MRLDSSLPSPTYSGGVVSYRLGYEDGGTIRLNGNIFPNPGKPIGTYSVSVLAAFNQNYHVTFDAAKLLTLTILHELSHAAQRPNDQGNAAATKAFNERIIKNCM